MSAKRLVALSAGLVILAILVLCAFATREMSLAQGLREIAGTLWGVATLVDLYAGLLFVGVWITVIERSPARAAPWILGLLLLGNLVTMVYIFVRALRVDSPEQIFLPKPR